MSTTCRPGRSPLCGYSKRPREDATDGIYARGRTLTLLHWAASVPAYRCELSARPLRTRAARLPRCIRPTQGRSDRFRLTTCKASGRRLFTISTLLAAASLAVALTAVHTATDLAPDGADAPNPSTSWGVLAPADEVRSLCTCTVMPDLAVTRMQLSQAWLHLCSGAAGVALGTSAEGRA
jgi:hypothetical protein